MLLCTVKKGSSGMPLRSVDNGPIDGFHAFKKGPLDGSIELGEKKSHREQDQVNREVVPVRRCSWPGTAGRRCIVVVICRANAAESLCNITKQLC